MPGTLHEKNLERRPLNSCRFDRLVSLIGRLFLCVSAADRAQSLRAILTECEIVFP